MPTPIASVDIAAVGKDGNRFNISLQIGAPYPRKDSPTNGRAQFPLSRYIRGFAIKPAATHCKRFALRCDLHLRYLRNSRPRVANCFAPTAPIFQLMPIFPFLAPGPNPAVNADAPPAALRARRGSPVTLIR